MQIRKSVRLAGGIYHSELSLGPEDPISTAEQSAINYFGPLQVEVGGTVSANGSTATLDTKTISIPGGLPYKVTFDLDDYVDAEGLAHVWADQVKGRIANGLAALLAQDPGSLGVSEENILPVPGDRPEDDLQTSDWMNLSI